MSGCIESGMTALNISESHERLIRVRTNRRGEPVEFCVQYEAHRDKGCAFYRIVRVEDLTEGMDSSTGTN
jgi:hypothetical protein